MRRWIGPRTPVVLVLGLAQTLAWASSFYLPSLLAAPISRELGISASTVFAALSGALVLSAFISPWAGRWIDRHGGRGLLMASSGLFVVGLLLLAQAGALWSLLLAWWVLGVAMGVGLYDAAFAALVRLFGRDARQTITGITLIAGFASTVGWPLTAWMEVTWGWRGACLGWALLHVVVGLPLNAWLPRAALTSEGAPQGAVKLQRDVAAVDPVDPTVTEAGTSSSATALPTLPTPPEPPSQPGARSLTLLLIGIFTLMGFVSGAVTVHIPTLLQAAGLSLAAAVGLAALIGPSQVVARLFEFGALRRRSPLWTAQAASLGHPLAVALILLAGAPLALPFVVLHGLGNGLLTIVRGTLPLMLFGAQGYGARQGWIALPGRLVGAVSPWLFGLAIERWGVAALWLTALASVLAMGLIWRLPKPA